ncbi:MAG: TIGR01777 family protein [Solirubrobacterales bacterium]|nr:TIGR01777 family protein [Solirubrobacterales bacterium]
MRVLITGASGMIGSRLADALLKRGDQVVGVSRNPDGARERKPELEWHGWDSTDERPPDAALEGTEAVVNLIGEAVDQRFTDDAKQRIRESRLRSTKNLVDAIKARAESPSVLVSGSAVGIYGDRPGETLTEDSATGDDFLAKLCVDWEAAANEAESAGVRVATLRTGLVLDPSGGLLGPLLLPFKLGVGGPIAGGGFHMPWIHRDDEVALLAWLIREPAASGAHNGSAPNPVTNKEFSKTLGKVLRRPALAPIPKLAVAALRGSEMADNATADLNAIPKRALDEGFDFRFPKLEPALRDLLG